MIHVTTHPDIFIFLSWLAPVWEVQQKPLLDVRHPKLSLQLRVQQMGVTFSVTI